MDGLYDHLYHDHQAINDIDQIQRDLEYEDYDSDAVLADVPELLDRTDLQSNIAAMCSKYIFESIQRYVYLNKCMSFMHFVLIYKYLKSIPYSVRFFV